MAQKQGHEFPDFGIHVKRLLYTLDCTSMAQVQGAKK